MKQRIIASLFAGCLLAQPLMGLEITRKLTPEQIVTKLISFNDIEKAKELLGLCSAQERQTVTGLLRTTIMSWIAQHGAPEKLAGRFSQDCVAGYSSVGIASFFCAVSVAAIGKWLYNFAQLSEHLDNNVWDYCRLHRVTNPDFLNRSGVVHGVPLTSPWFVDGQELNSLGDSLVAGTQKMRSLKILAQGIGIGLVGVIFWGALGHQAFVNSQKGQEDLDRLMYMVQLAEYLEKPQQ